MMKLDIRTKIIILLTVSICTFIVNTLWIEVFFMIALSAIQLASGKRVFSRWLLSAYVIFFFAQCVILPLMPELLEAILSVIAVQFRTMIPLLMGIFLIVRTTKVNELIATMTKMKTPKPATITLAVTLRYFPAIVEEWSHIREAMRLRPIASAQKNLLKKKIAVSVECYLVPLFIAASKTADELTAAAITRGIENPVQRTCRGYHPFSHIDFLFLFLCVLTIAVSGTAKAVGLC